MFLLVLAFSLGEFYEKTSDACVTIYGENGMGSGAFCREDGWIITAAHVVTTCPPYDYNWRPYMWKKKEIFVRWKDQDFECEDIKIHPAIDCAFVKIKSQNSFPYLELSDKKLERGEEIYCVGNPSYMMESLIKGYFDKIVYEGTNTFLRHYPSFYKGESGGPVCNKKGQIIGIRSLANQDTKQGLAVPAYLVKHLIPELSQEELNCGYLGGIQICSNVHPRLKGDFSIIVDNTHNNCAHLKELMPEGTIILSVDGLKGTPENIVTALMQKKKEDTVILDIIPSDTLEQQTIELKVEDFVTCQKEDSQPKKIQHLEIKEEKNIKIGQFIIKKAQVEGKKGIELLALKLKEKSLSKSQIQILKDLFGNFCILKAVIIEEEEKIPFEASDELIEKLCTEAHKENGCKVFFLGIKKCLNDYEMHGFTCKIEGSVLGIKLNILSLPPYSFLIN